MLTRQRLEQAIAILATEIGRGGRHAPRNEPQACADAPGGVAILEALLDHYGLSELIVSDAGIREGAILAVAHSGTAWRDQLPWLAHGWG